MRLPDIVNQIQRRISEITNTLRHPDQAAKRVGRKRWQAWYENAELPGGQKRQPPPPEDETTAAAEPPFSPTPPPTSASKLPRGVAATPAVSASPTAVLISEESAASVSGHQTFYGSVVAIPPSAAGFESVLLPYAMPPLQPGEILQGAWWGRYTLGVEIKQYQTQETPWMRLYEGIAMNGNEPVWIYEYLLTEELFNDTEAVQRSDTFRKLVNQNLRLGNGSDFRLVKLKDVLIDVKNQRRGYLITRPVLEGMTLAQYIKQHGAMSPRQVRQVLNQVLQSLQYLHTTYRVRWIDDRSDRGLVHGNLALDTLWLRFDQTGYAPQDERFFVYLSRFALWEHACWPPGKSHRIPYPLASPRELGSFTDDLADLGHLAFALLKGDLPGANGRFTHSPDNEAAWPQTPTALALQPFILRLINQDTDVAFKSADTALVALRLLPEQAEPEPEPAAIAPAAYADIEPISPDIPLWLPILLAVLGLGSLLTYYWLRRIDEAPRIFAEECSTPCTIREAASQAPLNTVNYAIAEGTSWFSSFNHFIGDSLTDLETSNETGWALENLLERRSNWVFNRAPLTLESVILEFLERQSLQFALLQDPDLPSTNLTETVLARDGIVFFVVFSDENRDNSIPKRLKGSITLRDIGRLYSQPNAQLNRKPVKLYFPQDGATVELLRNQLITKNLLTEETAKEFDRLHQSDIQDVRTAQSNAEQGDLYGRMLKEFEDPDMTEAESGEPKIIGIGFDRLSRVFGQCSVYPLTVETGMTQYSPLVEGEGQPITPTTDLCGDKGGYWINTEIFERDRYPFSYDLSVVYPACDINPTDCVAGQTFADMMLTTEGQYLLSEAGLVPLEPIDKLRRILWSEPHE